VKAPETIDKIPRAEDTPSPDDQKSESTTDEPQSVSGTKSSPNLAKALSPENPSPGQAIPSLNPIENPQSPESTESPKTTPPSPGLMDSGLLVKLLLVATLLSLNPKVFLGEPRW
jgi:hypothetical protein